MSLSYIVSAKKATIVTHSIVGNFTGPRELNLLLAKVNRVHIYKVATDGLKSIQEVPVFGTIKSIKLFRVEGENKDSLLILTAKFHLAILSWDEKKNALVTRAAGSVADRVGKVSDHGTVVTVHKSGLIGIRIYDSSLKIIQWSDGKELKCFKIRLQDLAIVDLTFLHTPGDEVILAYINHDINGRHLKVVEVSVIEKEIKKAIGKQDNIANEACLIIPVAQPYGGVIVVGQEAILYNRPDNSFVSVSPTMMLSQPSQFLCHAPIDKHGQRFLLGDDRGKLCMLVLDVENKDGHHTVKDMKLELLGETSCPECLVYLDNGIVFVGSRFGDSQLIRLTSEPNHEGSFVQVIETFVNLAPIRDMTLIEADGQTHLVTASGNLKDSTLRIIRNGIGIEEKASVELPGIKGIFTLKINSEFDNYLVISFAEETHILHLDGEELEDTELYDLCTTDKTLWAGQLCSTGTVLQVTPTGMRMCKEGSPMVEWKSTEQKIDLVAVNGLSGQVVVVSGSTLHYVTCTVGTTTEFVDRGSHPLQYEVSCIDISPIGDTHESTIVAVGLWSDNSTAILSLPDFKQIVRERLPVDVLPRSVLLTVMEKLVYILVALGDGSLYYYVIDMDTGTLRDLKKTSLGTHPPSLHKFQSNGDTHVFACSDRPTVIFSSSRKLVFSNVNLKLLTQICHINSSNYRNCLVMSDGETLSIGTVDDIQKLHIRTVYLGESCRRIAYQKETGTLGILTNRDENTPRDSISNMAVASTQSKPDTASGSKAMSFGDNPYIEKHFFVVLDANTYEPLHSFELYPQEHGISIISARLGEDARTYYIVGTANVLNEETECKSGRILMFEVGTGDDRHRLRKVSEKEIKGCPYAMDCLGNKLIIGVNSSVRLFEWPDSDKPELRLECSHFNHIRAISLKVKGDQIVVGDIMRSICILSYKNMECVFEEAARDFRALWMTTVEFIDAETVLGAEASMNVFTCEMDRSSPDDKLKLKDSGQYYLGELINVFRRGSLVASHVDSQLPVDKPILFGTAEGSIGLIVQLPESHHEFIKTLEKAVAKDTSNCMRIDHALYRQFVANRYDEKAFGFIDGDLIESVLEWPREVVEQTFQGIQVPGARSSDNNSEEILKIIEDLSRIH